MVSHISHFKNKMKFHYLFQHVSATPTIDKGRRKAWKPTQKITIIISKTAIQRHTFAANADKRSEWRLGKDAERSMEAGEKDKRNRDG